MYFLPARQQKRRSAPIAVLSVILKWAKLILTALFSSRFSFREPSIHLCPEPSRPSMSEFAPVIFGYPHGSHLLSALRKKLWQLRRSQGRVPRSIRLVTSRQ